MDVLFSGIQKSIELIANPRAFHMRDEYDKWKATKHYHRRELPHHTTPFYGPLRVQSVHPTQKPQSIKAHELDLTELIVSNST
jgi:hypothetical protein